ncbi:LytTR family transcriptional regulator DNA-binding domain-containing protein [Lysinibacillus fusiformis]|uniref:LytTR family transcriptional regulator DNA-binding domain-containing protein n=1 Tax=Lysinibacillus fusiformis TaxID=28031 RepID=UPI0004681871|nr:LytTR family transcriptional regulator DNA-binding domain-containing protein [Lysinibacillus fusiformis]
MEQHIDILVDPYIEGGNVIYPSFPISIQPGMIIGIYTDVSKTQTLMQWFMKRDQTFTYFRESALYERLTVREHIRFYLKLFKRTTNETENLLKLFSLTEQKNSRISKLSTSEKQRLKLLSTYLQEVPLLVLEEPFQNIDEFSKQNVQQILKKLTERQKSIILLSNNLEDLMIASTAIHRLDGAGLHTLDVKEEELEQTPPQLENSPIRIDKIPTKKNDKIILFNPPEIDYIESVEGIVSVNVAGEAYPCTLSLNELEQKLTPFGFFRSHRSYIVNLQKVREIITWTRNSYSLALNSTDKTVVPLSKNKLADLKEILGI